MINEETHFEDFYFMKNPETEGFPDTTEAYVNNSANRLTEIKVLSLILYMGEPEEKFLLEGHEFLFVTQTKKLESSSFEYSKDYKNIIKTNEKIWWKTQCNSNRYRNTYLQ